MNPPTTTTTIKPTPPSPPTPSRLTTILGSSLEAIIHELLYLRSLYPPSAFTSTRYLGVACHACRHPKVVDYIYETLVVSTPAICMGVADELVLVLYDTEGREGEKVLERFVVAFDVGSVADATGVLGTGSAAVQGKVQELQRSLRDVLLKIISMEGSDGSGSSRRRGGRTGFSGTATFKLCLRCRSAKSAVDANEVYGGGVDVDVVEGEDLLTKCPELDTAMQDGKWFRSDTETCQFGDDDEPSGFDCDRKNGDGKACGVTRPIKSVNVPSCGLRMQLLMECEA